MPADRARLLFEKGAVLRHLGRSDEALRVHLEGTSLLDPFRRVLGAEASEHFELQRWLSAMDEFQLDEAVTALRMRLVQPFMSVRNELLYRGALAQALGMKAQYAEAVA